MKIRVKMMGMLKDRQPEDGYLQLPDDAAVQTALETLRVAPESVNVLTVNGRVTRDQQLQLKDGDELVVLPPVGGG